jgi:hypothetical protein
MDANMNAAPVKSFFNNSFVTIHITVQETQKNKGLENPGDKELKDYFGGSSAGLPFWAILDATGTMLTNGNDENGENLGCPATPAEVAAFVNKLRAHTTEDSKTINNVLAVFTK